MFSENGSLKDSRVIGRLLLVCSVLYACAPKDETDTRGETQDTIQFSNVGMGQVRVLVDGNLNGVFVNDYHPPLERLSRDTFSIGNFGPSDTNRKGEIVAFAEDRVPVVHQVQWTDFPDEVPISLKDPIEIELALWIVTTSSTLDYKNRQVFAEETSCGVARNIWGLESHGLRIKCLPPEDKSQDTNKILVFSEKDGQLKQIVANKLFSESPFSCLKHGEAIKTLAHAHNTLNVFYVDSVIDEKGVRVTNGGVWCPNVPNVIAIGRDEASLDALAHHLGHAFSLDDIDTWDCGATRPGEPCFFDELNVMSSKADNREYLTEGQLFRVFFNSNSAINQVYAKGPGVYLNRECGSTVTTDLDSCPPIQKRLWGDGGKSSLWFTN